MLHAVTKKLLYLCTDKIRCKQVMYDPSPSPPSDRFSSEFRSFVDACLLKEADARPTAEQVNISSPDTPPVKLCSMSLLL